MLQPTLVEEVEEAHIVTPAHLAMAVMVVQVSSSFDINFNS
tara:strand:- start:2 stop:124 length:123 start_codon:yes stop_codon:yes gene_type:complete